MSQKDKAIILEYSKEILANLKREWKNTAEHGYSIFTYVYIQKPTYRSQYMHYVEPQEPIHSQSKVLYKKLATIPKYQENIAFRDVFIAIESVENSQKKNIQDIQPDEFAEYIDRKLLTHDTYTFYYPVY